MSAARGEGARARRTSRPRCAAGAATTSRSSSPNAPTARCAHRSFRDLATILRPGDLLVVNTSATLPAALPGQARRAARRAASLDPPRRRSLGRRAREPRTGRRCGRRRSGRRLELPDGGRAELVAPFAGERAPGGRTARARTSRSSSTSAGTASRSATATSAAELPLDAYQTVFAREPGSAEMPSAGRPFTAELVTELVARGVLFAPITLHTGVSSPELGEPPYPERYRRARDDRPPRQRRALAGAAA